MFPVPPYLHARNNQILEVTKALASSTFRARGNKATKAYEQRLSSVHQCVNYAQRYPWNAYLLHLCVLTTYMLTWFHLMCCVLKPCVNLNYFLCAFTIVINSKRGGTLKAGVLIVMYIAT